MGCPLKGAYLEVTGAGDSRVNGWYARKKKEEGPPSRWPSNWNWKDKWRNADRHWYEKDDGCFIYRTLNDWYICDSRHGYRNYFYRLYCTHCNSEGVSRDTLAAEDRTACDHCQSTGWLSPGQPSLPDQGWRVACDGRAP